MDYTVGSAQQYYNAPAPAPAPPHHPATAEQQYYGSQPPPPAQQYSSTSSYYSYPDPNSNPNPNTNTSQTYESYDPYAVAYPSHSGYGGSASAAAAGDPYSYPSQPAYHTYGAYDPHAYAQATAVPGTSDGGVQWAPHQTYPTAGATPQKTPNFKWPKKPKVPRPAGPPAYCEVCKISCNTLEVLASHKLGRRHKKNLEKLQESITPKTPATPAAGPLSVTVNPKPTLTASNGLKSKSKNGSSKKRSAAATMEDLEVKKRRVFEAGAPVEGVRVCGVCNVVVNSQKVFDYHMAGAKHALMVKKLQGLGV